MKKKLVSLLLAGSVVASMAAIASVSASAIIDSNGCYAPGENVTCGTYRYYFALPNTWLSEYSDTAGAYWYNGTDACGAVDGSGGDLKWPGYKAQRDEYKSSNYGLYYVDCPTDVPQIIWNNYTDGGEDKEAPIYLTAKQSNDAPTEFYVADDSDLYDQDWFDEMEESYKGDKAKLGDFADNFFYDEVYGLGFAMNFDNMIFVVPAEPNGENFQGKPTYNGDWYFYYGNGEYGTYPTKEEAEEKGTLLSLEKVATPDEPTPGEPSTADEPGSSTGSGTTIKDVATGVTVSGSFESDVELVVKEVKLDLPGVRVAYDITLVKDGKVVQPTEPITISIPYEEKDCHVIYVKDDKSTEDVKSSYADGKYTFDVAHLSTYAIVGPTNTDATSSVTPGASKNNSGAVQTGEATYAVILLVVLAAVSGVVVFTRKKYN